MILRTSGHLRIEENLTSTGGLVKKLDGSKNLVDRQHF